MEEMQIPYIELELSRYIISDQVIEIPFRLWFYAHT